MSKEALQIALKELENCTTWHLTREQFDKNVTAIKVIKQALAAPVQEPVAHINQNGVIHEAGYEWGPTNELTALYATPPAQEFVCSTGLCHYKAQRQWVGLTDEEIKHMLELFVIPPHHVEMVVRAIEAKLKEKNT